MNWYSEHRGEDFGFHLLAIGLSVILIIGGSGAFSADQWLLRKME